MANVFTINAYQINQSVVPLTSVLAISLPVTGVSVQDVTGSPTRSLSTGVNVYSMVQVLVTGTKYYCRETSAAIIALIA